MKRFDLLNPDRLITPLRWLVWPAIIAYLASMVVYPWVSGRFQWSHVEAVWDHWQSLNVGMLALIASVIAFEATRYNEHKQRKRDFLAARAFLPASLSELVGYFKESAAIYIVAWDEAATLKTIYRGAPPASPELPSSYKAVFAECIKHAEPEVGDFLASMLSNLQVHDARMRELVANYRPIRHTLFSYLHSIGELQTQANKLFNFARGEEGFDSTPISWDEFHNAYKNLRIDVEDYDFDLGEGVKRNLTDFTKRAIARERGEKVPPYPDK